MRDDEYINALHARIFLWRAAFHIRVYAHFTVCPVSPIHTADADTTHLSSWVSSVPAVWTQFASSSRRLPTASVDNWKLTKQTPQRFDYVNFDRFDTDNFFNNDVIMSSVVTKLKSSTAQDYCKLGHDCRRVRSHRRRDSTVESWVASASAVCIGQCTHLLWVTNSIITFSRLSIVVTSSVLIVFSKAAGQAL